ncbi:taste receptor type 1 member 3 [Alligator mississippiensis]|uniref:Taste receptor type 1 member 3 n=1 Tax=Alligator mississippiensis TaxID=8496 RepID=A0A151N443_ALLMI|nr:taste receptor type 1 member 3 [Alligator mississippiensis]KYO31562.1 taste receptor type 1 member 3 [Alligator mississippiensis]
MASILLLLLSSGSVAARELTCMSAQFKRPGHYILGGLFPFGINTVNLSTRVEPTAVACERLYATGLIWALGMKFTVDEINNSTSLLPGVQLGYEIYDSCFEPVVALQPSLLFLTQERSAAIDVLCNYTDYQPRVAAVIGPHTSDLCMATAKLFSFFLTPQVSYGASADKLSNSELYPSFFRTVPSDKLQVKAMIHLLKRFEWNWIAVIGSDDEYGREGLSLFTNLATSYGICIAYEGVIPTDWLDPNPWDKLDEVIKYINSTQVNVVVLFSIDRPAQTLLERCIKKGLSPKVWIATEAWVMSDIIISIPHIRTIGTVIGFIIKGGKVLGFEEYVAQLFTSIQQESFCQASREWSRQMESGVLGPQCEHCDHVSWQDVASLVMHRQTYAVYMAVYSVAHALHKVLGCTKDRCSTVPIKSWQLLEVMRMLQFEVHNYSFKFDQSQSTNMGYEILLWSWQNHTLHHVSVGKYENSLSINNSLIQFHTEDNKNPMSTCFSHCKPGQLRRVKGFHLCCYDCIDCPINTYKDSKEERFCIPCSQHQWSPAQSIQCWDRTERYLFWGEPLTIGFLILTFAALALSCLAAALFYRNLSTPLVQAAGGWMSICTLLSLSLMSVSTILYVGKPRDYICLIYQPIYALCLSICFSTLLVKSLQIALVTEFKSCARTLLPWVTQRRAWILVAFCFLVESLLCLGSLCSAPPLLKYDYKLLPTETLVHCQLQSWLFFLLVHGFNTAMAFICFLCTFMVQTSGKKYNVARGITFTMLTYFLTWIFFIATYTTIKPTYKPVAQMGAILSVVLGTLIANYLPKCYVLQFKPDWNTLERFQNYAKEPPEDKDSG